MNNYEQMCCQAKEQELEFISEHKFKLYEEYSADNIKRIVISNDTINYQHIDRIVVLTWLPSTDDLIEELEEFELKKAGKMGFCIIISEYPTFIIAGTLKEALLQAVLYLKYNKTWEGGIWK